MANTIFKKIDETCGNIFLIDENLCLNKSFDIIEYNVNSHFQNLNFLNNVSEKFNLLYSNFSRNSASWMTAIDNFQTLSAVWFSAETTTKILSANWQKDVHLIYNEIVPLVDYYLATTTYKNKIKDWLNNNFNSSFPNGQGINIDVYLTANEDFTWNYYKTYFENCVPPNASLPPRGCSCPTPSRNCNNVHVNGGQVEGGACTNAAKYCNQGRSDIIGNDVINCPNRGARDVVLTYSKSSTDKSLSRVISIRYIKENNIIREA